MRRKGIATYEAANDYLENKYLPDHNRRFARAAAKPEDYHGRKPTARELRPIFRLETERTISNDWVVRHDNRYLYSAGAAALWTHTKQGAGVRMGGRSDGGALPRGADTIYRAEGADTKTRCATSACCPRRCGEESQGRPSVATKLSKHEAPGCAPGYGSAARWHAHFRCALKYMMGDKAIDRTEFKVELGIKKATERLPFEQHPRSGRGNTASDVMRNVFIGPAVIYGKGAAA